MQNINEIEELVKLISKLPGLGPKSAKRIVLKLINSKDHLLKPMAYSLTQVYKNVSRCKFSGTLKSNLDGCNNCENKNEKSLLINNTTSNLKRFWCPEHVNINWFSEDKNFLEEFLHQSTQIKNIWIPYGE